MELYAIYKRLTFNPKTHQVESEGVKKYITCKQEPEYIRVAMLIWDKIKFILKNYNRPKNSLYINTSFKTARKPNTYKH